MNSAISLGAGEEGNRNLRETEKAPSCNRTTATTTAAAAAADATTRRGHDAQQECGKTGGGVLLVDPFPSCRQLRSENLVPSAGLGVSGVVTPSYSWLTGSRMRATGTCCADSREGSPSGRPTSNQGMTNTEQRRGGGCQGTAGNGRVGTATRRGLTTAKDREGEGGEGGGGGGGGGAAGSDEIRQEERGGVNSWDSLAATDCSLFIDEEELVGKAVKALRTALNSTGPRWTPADDRIDVARGERRQQSLDPTDGETAVAAAAATAENVSSAHAKEKGSSAPNGRQLAHDSDRKGNEWLMKVRRAVSKTNTHPCDVRVVGASVLSPKHFYPRDGGFSTAIIVTIQHIDIVCCILIHTRSTIKR